MEQMTASGGRGVSVKGGGMEQRGKRTHGHGQQGGDCWREENMRRLNDNGKYNKDYIFKK